MSSRLSIPASSVDNATGDLMIRVDCPYARGIGVDMIEKELGVLGLAFLCLLKIVLHARGFRAVISIESL